MKEALLRALIGGVIACGATFFTTLATSDLRTAAIAGGSALFTYLVARGGVEGFYDARRAANGDTKPSDVQSKPPLPAPAPS